MPTALADKLAAETAGYTFTTTDRGVSADAATRYSTVVEKHLTGSPGLSGAMWRAYGEGSSEAAAEADAIAALNAQRSHRYGHAAAGGNVGPTGGPALTVDEH